MVIRFSEDHIPLIMSQAKARAKPKLATTFQVRNYFINLLVECLNILHWFYKLKACRTLEKLAELFPLRARLLSHLFTAHFNADSEESA